MATTRREFMQMSMAASAAVATGGVITPWTLAQRSGKANKSLKILILGGTRFLGPATVEACLARGHEVTLFNRGRSNTHLFPNIEKLYGDRDPRKADERTGDDGQALEPRWGEGEGLKSLSDAIESGRTWDAVVDTSGYFPRMVSASAALLAPACEHYTFISSVSVYASLAETHQNETSPVGTMEDPSLETMGDRFQYYGPLKALCEQAASEATGGRAANVRPGLIVGPRDGTDRFSYWPVRISKGGNVLAPGNPDDPIQIIDVRDLAEFVIHLAEQNTTGPFNALGPAPGKLTMGKLLDSCKRVSGSDATFTWTDADFLEANNVSAWGNMPVWVPPRGDSAGFHMWDISAPLAAGLKFRSIDDTVRGTLDWWASLDEEQLARHPMNLEPPRAGISAERESELLKLFGERS